MGSLENTPGHELGQADNLTSELTKTPSINAARDTPPGSDPVIGARVSDDTLTRRHDRRPRTKGGSRPFIGSYCLPLSLALLLDGCDLLIARTIKRRLGRCPLGPLLLKLVQLLS